MISYNFYLYISTKLKSDYIIIICIFFHLMCTYDFRYLKQDIFSLYISSSFILNLSPPGVLQFNKRYYSSAVAYDKGLEVIYSTVSPLCSCFGRITPAPDYFIFTQVQWVLNHTYGLALCLKYLNDFSLLLANS